MGVSPLGNWGGGCYKNRFSDTVVHEQQHRNQFTGQLFSCSGVLDSDFSDSDVDIWGEDYPFFIKPNLKFDDDVIVERLPRFLRYPGDNEERTLSNTIDCKLLVRNIPPSNPLSLKGRAAARKVSLKLHLQREQDNQQYDFQLIWLLGNNPLVLDEIANDGQPVPVYFLRFEPEKAQIWIPTGPVFEPGKYGHQVIPPGTYNLTLLVGSIRWEKEGVNLPDFLKERTREPDLARYCREDDGYVVYFDRQQYDDEGYGLVITCRGAISLERVKKLFADYKPAEMWVNGEPFEGT